MVSETSDRPHVLILGAGLGGMTLAQSLRKQGVTTEIFERDAGLHARSQGWAIALHMILDQFDRDLPDDMPSISTVDHLFPLDLPPEFVMYSENNQVGRVSPGDGKRMVRANRARLRDWLSTNLDVSWGKHVSRIEEHDGKVTLHFDDGTSATGDVLVGADGVNSIVRSHLLGGKNLLETVPVAQILGEATLTKEQYQRQLALGHSAWILNRGAARLFVGLNSISKDTEEAYYYWFYAWTDEDVRSDSHWVKTGSRQELYDYVAQQMETAGPGMAEIIHLTKPEGIRLPPPVLRDMVLTELPNTHVTLLGDAAHPMTPYRGEGGNQAMRDSLSLGQALGRATKADVLEQLKAYQDEMLARGSEAVRNSRAAVYDDGSGTVRGWSRWGKTETETPAAAPAS